MIVAIDPGGVSGLAILSPGGALNTHEIPGGFDGLSDWLGTGSGFPWSSVDGVVIENFRLRPGAKSAQMDAVWLVGAVKHLCRQNDILLVIQEPAQAKSFADNNKLKSVGWYTVGEDHGRDATRHLLVALCSGSLPAAYDEQKERVLGLAFGQDV